jgi:hypothetical protein
MDEFPRYVLIRFGKVRLTDFVQYIKLDYSYRHGSRKKFGISWCTKRAISGNSPFVYGTFVHMKVSFLTTRYVDHYQISLVW